MRPSTKATFINNGNNEVFLCFGFVANRWVFCLKRPLCDLSPTFEF